MNIDETGVTPKTDMMGILPPRSTGRVILCNYTIITTCEASNMLGMMSPFLGWMAPDRAGCLFELDASFSLHSRVFVQLENCVRLHPCGPDRRGGSTAVKEAVKRVNHIRFNALLTSTDLQVTCLRSRKFFWSTAVTRNT